MNDIEMIKQHLKNMGEFDDNGWVARDALFVIEKLQAEIDSLKTERKWIPVEDHLPEVEMWKSVTCWVAWLNKYNNKIEVQRLRYAREMVRGKDTCRWKSDLGLFHEKVIAWMPLSVPQPPKEGEHG